MNINIRLAKNFTTQYNKMLTEFGEEMAKLNGFADSQLSYTDFIDNFVDKKVVADASIDGNSNVGHKDIVSLENEMSKPHSKLLAFNKIYYELNKQYSFKDANDWLRHEWDGHFYLHDAYSATMKPYCYAYDLEELVTEGLFFIERFNAQPPQHLSTYTDFVGEFVSWACNRSSGAVGLPSFLIYSYYFWRKDCQNDMIVGSPDYYRDQEFQRIIYKLNQPYLRGGIQSAFTNFSIFDRPYLEALFGSKLFPDGTPIMDSIEEIIQYEKDFMIVASTLRSQNMMTFPVLSFALLKTESGPDGWNDKPFARWCSKHNMKWADSNFFNSKDVTSLSNCCRLISDIKNLGYCNSIGGTALEVGSVKVNTINLARLAYENKTPFGYLKALESEVLLCLKTLDVIRSIIARDVEKGLLPNYSLGLINLKTQYNTIGVIGLYEALQKYDYVVKDEFGYSSYSDKGIDFAKEIFQLINSIKDEFVENKDYSVNIEQIPGERAAAILMQKDHFFYPEEEYELPLYGNQWIPLGVNCTLQEKIKISSVLDKACNGGSIAHINLDAPLEDEETAWELLNYVADAGVSYFAFNLRINACKHNHGFYGDFCPTCGEPKAMSYQRIVGFLTADVTYSAERQAEVLLRKWQPGDLYNLEEI